MSDSISSNRPQCTTSARLFKLGESITFYFLVPAGADAGSLQVFPRYLERANPGREFVPGGTLNWLDTLESETIDLNTSGGRAAVEYRPQVPGNYLARWRSGHEEFYRYFAVIEDNWTVLSFSTHILLETEPTLQATGIPLDYRLPIERFDPQDPLFQKFLHFHRHFGCAIVPWFPDTPTLSADQRVSEYGKGLEEVRRLIPDPGAARSARLELQRVDDGLDPGYTETLMRLGVNDHCGLKEANAAPWLGMPEFPYFSSPIDCRKIHQGENATVVAHQWDFCGGWHFLGPASWHYSVSEDGWEAAVACLKAGMDEARNAAELSAHPMFLFPLYEGDRRHYNYPRNPFKPGLEDLQRMKAFVGSYQRLMAFEFPKTYKVAYARSIDVADYYLRHFNVTPRTVFVSKTDHLHYDMWWLCHWNNVGELITRECLPWRTRMSSIMKTRRGAYYKDPLACEYVLVEDQKRQLRFERECPNPVWWFDYTKQHGGPRGSAISHMETPDVEVLRSDWHREADHFVMRLRMNTDVVIDNYAICLWDVPLKTLERAHVQSDANDFLMARNTAGQHHLVLFFDLKPDVEIKVGLRLD